MFLCVFNRPDRIASLQSRSLSSTISKARRLLASGPELLVFVAATVGLGGRAGHAGSLAKVGASLARVDGTLEEDGVGAGGTHLGELIKGVDLSAGLEDAGAGLLGEAKGADLELGDIKETDVVGDGGNGNDDGVLLSLLTVSHNSGERHGGSVGLALEKTLQNDLVEGGSGPAGQEGVKLCFPSSSSSSHIAISIVKDINRETSSFFFSRHQRGPADARTPRQTGREGRERGEKSHLDKEKEVNILALWGLAVRVLLVPVLEIDTLRLRTGDAFVGSVVRRG